MSCYDSRFMFPDKVLHAIERYRCTTFAGVPTVYNILLRRSNLRSHSAAISASTFCRREALWLPNEYSKFAN